MDEEGVSAPALTVEMAAAEGVARSAMIVCNVGQGPSKKEQQMIPIQQWHVESEEKRQRDDEE